MVSSTCDLNRNPRPPPTSLTDFHSFIIDIMRQAGTISTQPEARRFADYLLSLGITSKVEPSGDQWAIWVHDENQMQRSRQELELFQAEPDDARYKVAAQTAKQVRREVVKKTRQAQRNYVDMRNEWANPWHRRPVTMSMIVFSALVFLHLTGIDNSYLFIGSDDTLREVREGEIWRLVTPIFMHAGPLHFVFNMFWLYDLGTLIERKLGSIRYLLLVLVIAVISNMAQFLMSGPNFLGMSGVVYGLFGYAWIRGRLDPTCGLYLRPDIVFWMLGFFLLCLTPVLPGVANWAHGGGLATGAAFGYLAYAIDQLRRRRR